LAVTGVLHDFQNRADFFWRQSALLAQHGAELLKNALGLGDLDLVAVHMDRIPAGDEADSQGIANGSQVLIAAAAKEQRFIAIVQSNGHFTHGRVNGEL
jgi:hypothetical protein